MRFTANALAGNIARFYNNSCNVRYHAGLPMGEPMMTRMVIVDEIKSINKYFTYLRPSKRYSW